MLPIIKDPDENVAAREELKRACVGDACLAARVKELCAKDLLFWVNWFAWLHEPRSEDEAARVLPFVTYPFQDEAFKEMEECFGKRDLCGVKSRGIGGTWMVLALFAHRWLFERHVMLAIVSRDQSQVDGSPRSLFAKLDFLIKRQPAFLRPNYFRKELLLRNDDSAGVIEGAATTGQMLRGDRYTSVFIDELSSFEESVSVKAWGATNGVTNNRFVISTPQGATGAFYKAAHNIHLKQCRWPWWEHPEMAAGLVIREDGKRSSPYYEKESRRLMIPALIAAELDMDFVGSSSPFFPPEILDAHIKKYARRPICQGQWRWNPLDWKMSQFVQQEAGPMRLWMPWGERTVQKGERYVIGCDISQGSGATNSVLSIANCVTREKVGEFASPVIDPLRFAELAASVAWTFNEAYICFGNLGPGTSFGKRLAELGYTRIYYRRDELGMTQKITKAMVPGYAETKKNKELLFRQYLSALGNGGFVNRSAEALEECRDYVYLPTGGIANSRSRTSTDPSGAGENHGDRATADAFACKALGPLQDLTKPPDELFDDVPSNHNPQPGSYAWAKKKVKEADERASGQMSWEESSETRVGWDSPFQQGLEVVYHPW